MCPCNQYLVDDCWWAGCRRPGTRSANVNVLDIPRARTTLTMFAVVGSLIWNNLLPSVRDPSLSEYVCQSFEVAPVGLGACEEQSPIK